MEKIKNKKETFREFSASQANATCLRPRADLVYKKGFQ